MKKLCKNIGKIFGIMGTFLFSICTRVLALNLQDILVTDLNPSEYGVSRQGLVIYKVFNFGKILLIPFIILIGLYIFLKKKDKEKYSKKINIIKQLLIIILIILIIIIGLNLLYLKYQYM